MCTKYEYFIKADGHIWLGYAHCRMNRISNPLKFFAWMNRIANLGDCLSDMMLWCPLDHGLFTSHSFDVLLMTVSNMLFLCLGMALMSVVPTVVFVLSIFSVFPYGLLSGNELVLVVKCQVHPIINLFHCKELIKGEVIITQTVRN
jgi:hypothetical protein